jgi:DNA-binding NarL/FixJ family response regulator
LKNKIKIIIADDHEITRVGINLMLSYEFKFQVVGEASNGNEAINLAKTFQPDIAILDIQMPDKNGIEVAKIIRKLNPNIKIVLLTALNDYLWVAKALEIDADGYIVKDIKQDEIIESLNKIIAGKKVFCKSVLKFLNNGKLLSKKPDNQPIHFSKRELEVLGLIAYGKTNIEISEILSIAPVTSSYYCRILKTKIGVNSRADLIKYSILKTNSKAKVML